MDEPKQVLVNYIEQARASGMDDSDIRGRFVQAGWRAEDIETAFASLGVVAPPEPTEVPEELPPEEIISPEEEKMIKKKAMIFGTGVLLVVVFGFGLYTLLVSPAKKDAAVAAPSSVMPTTTPVSPPMTTTPASESFIQTGTGNRARVVLPTGDVRCTEDGKKCADGTVVKRVPPLCEFAACP